MKKRPPVIPSLDADPSREAGRVADGLNELGFDDTDQWLEHAREADALAPLGAIDGYRIVDVCARGGQGVVYRARRSDDAIVALKRIHGGAQASPAARRRLSLELEAAGSLEHAAIVRTRPVYVDQELLVEMDWIDGVPLTRWARGGDDRPAPTASRMLDVFVTICDALAQAHDRGIVHRDLKPSNILVDRDDHPHVLDFGLAKSLTELGLSRTHATVTEQLVGTPAYAAPEQVSGVGEVDERSDVYSLGVILYEASTGSSPYVAHASLGRLLADVESGEPRRPRAVDPSVPRNVEAVILKAMQKNPDQRYASMTRMKEDLLRCRAGENVEAPRPGFFYDLRAIGRRHPVRSVLGLAAIAVLALTALIVSVNAVQLNRAHDETRRAHQAAERVSDFLTRLVLDASGTGREPALLTRLDEAARELETEFDGDPWARARGEVAFGRLYARLQAWERVDAHLSSALEGYRGIGPADRIEVAEAMRLLALARAHMGAGGAETMARDALAMVGRATEPGSRRPVNYLATLGEVLLVEQGPAGRRAAEESFDRAFELLGGGEPLYPAWAATTMTTYGRGLAHAGETIEAEKRLRVALELFERAGVASNDRNLRECRAVLAALRAQQGN